MAKKDTEVPDAEVEKNDEKDDEPGQKMMSQDRKKKLVKKVMVIKARLA